MLLVSLLLSLIPATQAEGAAYKSCLDLRKNFKYGVALSSTTLNKGVGPIFQPSAKATIYKLNKKLDTDRDNIVCELPKPKTVAVPELPPSQISENVNLCKIQEVSASRGMTGAGFPEWDSLTAKNGTVKWALIPIDFPDLPGEKNFRSRIDKETKLLSEWYETVSGGKFKVEWVILNQWATLPRTSKDYVIPLSVNVNNAPDGPKLFKDAMTAADPLFDFTNIQTVNFILPKGQKIIGESSQGFPWDQVVKEHASKEGRISSYSIPGQFFDGPGRTYWSYWAHEFGHAIGLPHIGSSREWSEMHAWDLMGSQDGPSRELSGWLRFIAGWLEPDQVYCRDASTIENLKLSLVPLSSKDKGLKLAVIPVSKTKALVMESRRDTKFSCPGSAARNGVLVYLYDSTLGHGENFLKPLGGLGRQEQFNACGAPPGKDFLLRTGNRIVFEGISVEVLKHSSQDNLLISKSE